MMLFPMKIAFAVIDIKQTIFKMIDGTNVNHNGTAKFAVNNGAGYAIGITTMVVDTGTGIVHSDQSNPAKFVMDAETAQTIHTIASTMETGNDTTEITFTPGLVEARVDDDTISFLPFELTAKVGEGNLTWTEAREIEHILDRGVIDLVREGDEQPMEVNLDFVYEFLLGDTADAPTLKDALKKRGEASHWVSTSSDGCEPFQVDILSIQDPTCLTAIDAERIRFLKFNYTSLEHDTREGTVAITGTCNAKEPVTDRVDRPDVFLRSA